MSSVVLLIAWVLEIVLVGWSVRHHLRVSQQRVQNASQHEQEQDRIARLRAQVGDAERKSGGGESLAVLSDSIDRDAEPPSVDQVGALRELAACVNQRGFEPDIGSPMVSVDGVDLVQDLRSRPEGLHLCHIFLRGPGSDAEDDQGLLELAGLAPFGAPDGTIAASELCKQASERCLQAGHVASAQTWRLLSEVVGNDLPSDTLLDGALAGVGPAAAAVTALSTASRGAGASLESR